MTRSARNPLSRNVEDLRSLMSLPIPRLLAADQQDSLLFALPAELRTIILKELLVNAHTIATREAYLKPPAPSYVQKRFLGQGLMGRTLDKHCFSRDPYTTVSGHHLYPEVLACCQQLFTEGLSILYNQNYLAIRILKIKKSGVVRPCACGSSSCWGCISIPCLGKKVFDLDWKLLQEPCEFMRRFERFQIEFDIDSLEPESTGVIATFTKLTPYFTNANVRVKFIGLSARASEDEKLTQLKILQPMRCKCVTILGLSGKKVTKIERTAASDTPAFKFHIALHGLKGMIRMLRVRFERRPDPVSTAWINERRKTLSRAVADFDEETFKTARDEVLKRFDEEYMLLRLEVMGNPEAFSNMTRHELIQE